MTEYVIAMKSGARFRVKIKDFDSFVREFSSRMNPSSIENLYVAGGMLFDVNDLSAIYPLEGDLSHHGSE